MDNFNQKNIWYRISKVAYFLILLSASTFFIYSIYQDKKPERIYDKTIIQCYNQNIYVAEEQQCDPSDISINLANRLCETGQPCDDLYGKKAMAENIMNRVRKKDPPIRQFEVYSKYKTQSSWIIVIKLSILSVALIVFVLEVIKRIFYYIAFGKLFIGKKYK